MSKRTWTSNAESSKPDDAAAGAVEGCNMSDDEEREERKARRGLKRKRKEREESADSESDGPDERDGSSSEGESDEEEEQCFLAIAEGDFEGLKQLHEAGHADLDACDTEEGDTTLGVACRFGHLDIAKWLAGHGVSLVKTGQLGDTPLHEACLNGHAGVVNWLLSQLPADALELANSTGMTPLGYACLQGHAGLVELLAAKGAKLDVVNEAGHTLMHLACSNGHLSTAKALVALGASTAAQDKDLRTPLHIACGSAHLEVARYLVGECGASLECADSSGSSPLHFACAAGDAPLALWILSASPALSTVANTDRNTALHYASQAGSVELVSALLEAGVERGAANADGDTPFLLACLNGHVPVCELLHARGEPLDTVNEMGCSGLLQACAADQRDVAAWLLPKAPALLESADSHGYTPLTHVAEQGASELCEWLLEKGARPDRDMLRIADGAGHLETAKLLKRALKKAKGAGASASSSTNEPAPPDAS